MRVFIFLVTCVFYAPIVHAYVPNLVTQESLTDITTITDPTLAQGFFGTLAGFPHTFEIRSTEPFLLSLHIRTPNVPSHTDTVSGIVIKEEKRGVSEVARLKAEDASWTVLNDTLTGTSYRDGSSFERELEPGVYRVEVHTPDNAEKYILMVGTREDMTIGYGALIGRLIDIQRFNEQWIVWVVRSPYVYVPLLIILTSCFVCGVWYKRRRISSNDAILEI